MYLQMSFEEFKKDMPELYNEVIKNVPAHIVAELEGNSNYVVRVDAKTNSIEFGFPSDNWSIA